MPAVREDRRAAPRRNDYRFSSLVLGIVKSTPFQMKVKQAQQARVSVAVRNYSKASAQ